MSLHHITLTRALAFTWGTLDLADALRRACARVEYLVDCTHGHSLEMDECNAAQRAGYRFAWKLERAGDAAERLGHELAAWVDRAQHRSPFTIEEIQAPLLMEA